MKIALTLHHLCIIFAYTMSGLYLHIPFCASRCIYCGFYSTTLSHLRQAYVDALCREMRLRRGAQIGTIYLGGGTPSQLTPAMLHQLFGTIDEVFDVSTDAEVTVECNPDDVSEEWTAALRQLPVNRVSMGIQTFDDRRLRFLHRRHDAAQAIHAIDRLRKVGIGNISIDLMFGLPGETVDEWKNDVEKALALGVEHLSAYSLMYEEGTPLHHMRSQHLVEETDDEIYVFMYELLASELRKAGYEHYEISNFARPGYRSRHNSSYWNGTPYLGIGAAAHSFDGHSRSWNVDNVEQYIEAINAGRLPEEHETLSQNEQFNELVATALRTCEGIDLDEVEKRFGSQRKHCLLDSAAPYLNRGWLATDGQRLKLTLRGITMSDTVMSDMMWV